MERLQGFLTNTQRNLRSYIPLSDSNKLLGTGMAMMLLIFLAMLYLSPLLYMGTTAFKNGEQLSDPDDPFLPSRLRRQHYQSTTIELANVAPAPPAYFYNGQEYEIKLAKPQGYTKPSPFIILSVKEDGTNVLLDISSPALGDCCSVPKIVEFKGTIVPKRVPSGYFPLYTVPAPDGKTHQYGYVGVSETGNTLWVDPTNAKSYELEIGLEETSPVYAESNPAFYQVPLDDDEEKLLLKVGESRRHSLFVDPDTEEITIFIDPDVIKNFDRSQFTPAIDPNYPELGEVIPLSYNFTVEKQDTTIYITNPFQPPTIKDPQKIVFVNPETGELIVAPGFGKVEARNIRPRSLDKVWDFHLEWQNFPDAIEFIHYRTMFFNTVTMAILGAVGTTLASTLVAYGFTRFRIPYANFLFVILLATIMLPPQVTQIPTYIVFQELGWIGTLLPLIVPHFFSNAWNVFLLRQYMMGIPTELDEAARVDGANPFQILLYVIMPAARPAMIAVFLFHFLWAWNEFQQPLIYIGGDINEEDQVIAVGLSQFSSIYSNHQDLMMAAGVLTMIVPLLVFFFAQRIFMQGVVITGVEK